MVVVNQDRDRAALAQRLRERGWRAELAARAAYRGGPLKVPAEIDMGPAGEDRPPGTGTRGGQ